jgi:flagellin
VIETVSDLAQDFGAELILESAEGIEIELDSVVVDNELGRMLYVGDPALANVGGTFDSLTNGFLGVNSEQTVSEVDLTTKEGAQEALRIVDLAIDQIGSFRSETGATQNRIERQLGSLSESLFQTESYVSRLRDADVAFEVAELAQSQILQNAGVQMLAQINVNTNIALQLIQGLS